MDWYSGSGVDDLIVPKDGGLSDRLPSPDSWSKWGIGVTESFPPHNKCGSAYHQNFYTENCFRSLYDEVEMEDFVLDKCQSSTSSACGGSPDDSVQRTILSNNQPDYQLELGGSRQMDDIFFNIGDVVEIELLCCFSIGYGPFLYATSFWSSLLEDLPESKNSVKSFCFSPKSQCGMMQSNYCSRDMNRDLENNSGDTQSLSSSRYLQTHAISPSLALEKEDITASEFVSSQQKDLSTIKGVSMGVSGPSKQNSMITHIDEETSLEESVLQELKIVMNQVGSAKSLSWEDWPLWMEMSEKTRICFRDALYRLAKSSKQHQMTQNQDGDPCVGIPFSWTPDPETARSESKKATESETNIIDRAIANLMFNKTDLNERHISMAAASSNSKEEVSGATESSDNLLYQLQICHQNDNQIQLDDALVPTLIHVNPYRAANLWKSFSRNAAGNKSLVLEF
ncbi:hypothetical protein TIFTF001_024677 [Ficus carica]|uniref:Uncharacterized protein n=1 Tax=Ficus carica TaxID=3494 RepID=A0AA88AID8_FICCA|nr:hypothetical protein TIFTF001_024677 [Ficus carica]